MVDFRKWLLAFAAAALLFGLGTSAYAQGGSAFVCQASAGNPNIVRAEGVAELVGDLILNCTGGTITPSGTAIPLSTVQISLNTNVTSRLTGSSPVDPASEAILAIDEPFPGTNGAGPFPATATPSAGAPTTQAGCVANGNCDIIGTGIAFGPDDPYNGVVGQGSPGPHYNVFQGIYNGGLNQINWQGVPIDAPGTQGTRVIRITNIRANANALSGGSSFVPTQITELIGVSGSQTIIINGPLQTVALIEKGLVVGAAGAGANYAQCTSLNAFLLGGFGVSNGTSIAPNYIELTATEGFGAAFKTANAFLGPDHQQNVFGVSYNTESGYVPGTNSDVSGLDQTGRFIGLADTGTEIQFTITGIPSNVQIFAPTQVDLVQPGGSVITTGGTPVWNLSSGGYADLVTSTTTSNDLNPPITGAVTTSQVTVSGGTATITYEIEADVPSIVESLIVPIEASYITSGSSSPIPGTVSVSTNFAPLATATQQTASESAPIPRFEQVNGPAAAFSINACTCNLLFPFVTNQAGFDTGVAIANTSTDPFGTAPQSGTVTLNYYGGTTGNGAAPPTYTSQAAIPAGQELVFLLSSGGGVPGGAVPSVQVPATPGFEGYIIAQSDFQYCHGFAFISDVGAQKLAEGYLAISLDAPGLNRTLNVGENEGH